MRRRISATPRLFSSWTGRKRLGGDGDAGGDDVEVGHDDDDDDETSFNFDSIFAQLASLVPPSTLLLPRLAIRPSPASSSTQVFSTVRRLFASWDKFSNQLLPNVQ